MQGGKNVDSIEAHQYTLWNRRRPLPGQNRTRNMSRIGTGRQDSQNFANGVAGG